MLLTELNFTSGTFVVGLAVELYQTYCLQMDLRELQHVAVTQY
jgi:hypothetical protein